MRKILYGSAAAIGALMLSQSAWAQADITYEQDIAAVCEVTSGDNAVTIDLSTGASPTETVGIDCNDPATVTATATKGAIENDDAITANLTGGVASVDYDLTVTYRDHTTTNIGSGTGNPGAGGTVTATNATAVAFGGTVLLDLAWTDPGSNLYAGTYDETITVTIAAN